MSFDDIIDAIGQLDEQDLGEVSTEVYARRTKFAQAEAQLLPPVSESEQYSADHGRKIDAIKAYRDLVDCPLLVAKAVIDAAAGR